ncbi:class I SAM-dependent DNA methyltransferase [Psychrobacter immobilis]|uniref:class I SAM-dependent DNA methyltransferase n=1 Tax=Psychrobacter immobilis TaxID=498 RepID=UPI00191A5D41|nr:class I SAM-dependent DNA methyltransferase [Psychrobacter immobilis]
MNVTQIEETVKKLASDVISSAVDKDQFIYELMAAYGHRRTTVSRIKSGERNLAKVAGEVRAKRHIYFKHSDSNKVFSDIDDMKKEPSVIREKIRFIIATDFNQFVAVDTRTHDTLDIEFSELGKHFDFFLPWAGMEKAVYQGDNPADVKAAEKMAKLFDLIKADNFSEENKNDTAALHSLNVFLTRLLFCFFAEDTGIFKDNQFSAELESHTKADGSDVDSYLNRLFEVLNTSKENRHDLPDYLAKFEYVNGGLFADTIDSPKFSTKSRRMLIECGSELDWSGINPDIFGSMIQAVVHPDQRGGMGMHYTSVINIMKVIEPLFLDGLYAELENIVENIDLKQKSSRLRKLHDRIVNIKIFDPACGSGNFLIIAFKELRKLEMEIIKHLQELNENEDQDDLFDEVSLDSSFSRIKLSQFYGMELDDFAHEVAILSLWLAEHQMNVEFKAEFGECEPTLPLQNGGQIACGNATLLDWASICPKGGEIMVLGNPPYLGFSQQSQEQKSEIKKVWGKPIKLDYISCWFKKASEFIQDINGKFSFVTTNSICQGEQVALMWPAILKDKIEISFAIPSFKWTNNAKHVAGVYCSIIGLSNKSSQEKFIVNEGFKRKVKHINCYLTAGSDVFVKKRSSPISNIPPMTLGDMAKDGGNLFLSKDEKDQFLEEYPDCTKFVRNLVGSEEFIKGKRRWCIWVEEADYAEANQNPYLRSRFDKVAQSRLASPKAATQKFSEHPYRFVEVRTKHTNKLLIPTVSSSRRPYIPIGFFTEQDIVNAPNNVIYNPEPYIFGVIHSKMHMAWVKAIGGKLKTDYRYSVALIYNNFPIPKLSEKQKNEIFSATLNILEVRESYSANTIAQLYDPDKMPEDLRVAHEYLDTSIDKIYQNLSFNNDEERLECLINLYDEMTEGQNA